MAAAGRVWIGVAGWDYADWNGVVYPAPRGRGFDRLAWLARFVDLIEINSTFYRPPGPHSAESWVRRTESRAGFRFTAKAHRSWTHPERGETPAIDATLDGLRPLRESGRLGALLLQFPQSFHAGPDALAHIERLVEAAEGWPLAVEVRHASWSAEEPAERLRGIGAGWCAVDQPRVGRSTLPLLPRVTAPVGYVRLHGRNRQDWFRPDAGRDARYDYLYGAGELDELAGVAGRMAEETAELYVVQNNHFRGQAVANALQVRHRLEGRRPRAPGSLVAAYPDLQSEVRAEEDRLF